MAGSCVRQRMNYTIFSNPVGRYRAIRGCCALLVLPLAACTASRPPVAGPGQPFDPIAFFSHPTRGEGRLKIVFRSAVAFHVEGHGTIGSDGTLHLEQTVVTTGKPSTHREWSIRRVADGSYRGTLSDATGPVVITVMGRRLRVRFAMRHGLAAEQWLVLADDGRSTQNRMTVRKFGIPVAVIDERIVRLP